MTQVAKLTIEQRDSITGKLFAPSSITIPVQDINDNWIISTQVQENCTVEELMWIKDLPLIEWDPKPEPPFPPEE